MIALPLATLIGRNDTHRLIPSQHRDGGRTVRARLTGDKAELADLYDLDNATNGRLLAENDLLPDIRVHELLFGVPYHRIVNASFTHAHPLGSRFNGPIAAHGTPRSRSAPRRQRWPFRRGWLSRRSAASTMR